MEKLLSKQITERILKELRYGVYASATRLPPETQIAQDLNVSRTAVRDSLAALDREGFITRKQGIGTLVNRDVLKVQTRMDLEKEFLDMIKGAGYKPALGCIRIWEEPAGPIIANRLQIAPEHPVIRVMRVITADGIPAIYCVDNVAKSHVKDSSYTQKDMEQPIFHFLQQFCDTEVYMDLTEVDAVAATPLLAQRLGLKEGAPILHMDEVGYDLFGNRVLYSDEYYRNGILHHMVMRRKI